MAVVVLKPDVRAEASGSEATSEDVAAQIVDLQLKADATAQAWTQAEQRAEELAVDLAQARADVTAATTRVDALRSDLTGLTVDRFAVVTHPIPLPYLELLVHLGGPDRRSGRRPHTIARPPARGGSETSL